MLSLGFKIHVLLIESLLKNNFQILGQLLRFGEKNKTKFIITITGTCIFINLPSANFKKLLFILCDVLYQFINLVMSFLYICSLHHYIFRNKTF